MKEIVVSLEDVHLAVEFLNQFINLAESDYGDHREDVKELVERLGRVIDMVHEFDVIHSGQ